MSQNHSKREKIPRYHSGRIIFFPILLYFLLVFPLLGFMLIKGFPNLQDKSGIYLGIDTTQRKNYYVQENIQAPLIPELKAEQAMPEPDSLLNTVGKMVSDSINISQGAATGYQRKSTNKLFSKSIRSLFNIVILLCPLVILLLNYPFKRYFKRKRKRKTISPKLYRYCRRWLLHTPLVISGIVFIGFSIVHGLMIYGLLNPNSFGDEPGRRLFANYLFISLVASLLTVLFIYFWQKHRVHIRYIEHVFTPDELQNSIFGKNRGKIRNRLYIASAMTTLLPLTIVLLYLILSLTPMKDMGELSPEGTKIVLGRLTDVLGPETDFIHTMKESGFKNLYYISALDNTLMFMGIFSGIFVSFVYILFFVNWSTAGIVLPVNALVRNMRETGEGKLGSYAIVRTNDEIGVMSEGYNLMSTRLTDQIFRISQMNEAYGRFVPNQFLELLEKENFTDIRLGDQVQREMSVLFSDIRGFTEMSEGMSPKDNFDFINHYLGYMEPVIRENNGFIDKFIGDSIMALFHNKVDDAIDAAIQMRVTLSQFNEDRKLQGKPIIDSGIGIHTGNLMLGVVGGEGRMDGTVISDAVNLASRLEGLTKVYRTAIIISEDTIQKLENPSRFNFRFLDIARVKGKKEAVRVYEVLDGEPEGIRQLKIETKTRFENGLHLYKNRNFEEAMKVFTDVISVNIHDTVATFYVVRCKNHLTKGIPDDWTGIETFETK